MTFNPTTISPKTPGPTYTVFVEDKTVCLEVEGIADTFEMDPDTAMEVGGTLHQAAYAIKFNGRLTAALANSKTDNNDVA